MTDKSHPFLPYGRQSIDNDDVAAVSAALQSDWLTTGPAVDAFEAAFAEMVDVKHAVSCSSGTAALHLAALALQLGPDDAVIVPTLTFLATANAVRYVGAEVIFADVDPDTGLITAESLRHAVNSNAHKCIKALFLVHLNGQCVNMAEIKAIADEYDFIVVEDACHAIGGTQNATANTEAFVGSCSLSDMTVFSFHPVKTITMGEGGLVTTNSDVLNERLRKLRNHGMVRDTTQFKNPDMAFTNDGAVNPWYYEMHELGYNYRASDIQCALGLSQLKKLNSAVARRTDLVRKYDQQLLSLSPIVQPLTRVHTGSTSWHLYVVLIDFEQVGIHRAEVMKRLQGAGIGTQVHYLPVHHQPYYRTLYGNIELPNADAYYARCLSLPLFPAMKDDDVKFVVNGLAQALSLNI